MKFRKGENIRTLLGEQLQIMGETGWVGDLPDKMPAQENIQ